MSNPTKIKEEKYSNEKIFVNQNIQKIIKNNLVE